RHHAGDAGSLSGAGVSPDAVRRPAGECAVPVPARRAAFAGAGDARAWRWWRRRLALTAGGTTTDDAPAGARACRAGLSAGCGAAGWTARAATATQRRGD